MILRIPGELILIFDHLQPFLSCKKLKAMIDVISQNHH
jgi:hypothetical protein